MVKPPLKRVTTLAEGRVGKGRGAARRYRCHGDAVLVGHTHEQRAPRHIMDTDVRLEEEVHRA